MKNYAKRILLLSAICYLPSAIMGCGYTTRSQIASRYRTIYVAPFVNKIDITSEANVASKYRIYYPMVETQISRYVIEEYLTDGNIKPVKAGDADLSLKGEVMEFRKDPLRYDESENVTEYRINLVVNLQLWDNKENKLVWEENNFTGDTSYFTTGTQSMSESAAVNYALTDLARRIVERTVEEW
jgi:hypothetical protein